MIRHNRNDLGNKLVKEQFGFLYNGYRNSTYYWEIVIIFRKITIIFISVFLSSSGTIIQVNN
jgi:hypothetical protein